MEQLQILDMHPLTTGAEHLAIPAGHPESGRGDTQIPDFALGPAVHPGSLLTATVTQWPEAPIGLDVDMGLTDIGCYLLMDNFDSTEGEIRCYTESGHRGPPLD
jgi:hypothetical protein